MGRKKKEDHLLKHPRRKPAQKVYNIRPVEPRGVTYREPVIIKSFWKEYTMDQVIAMSDEEVIQAVDRYLEAFIYRQKKQNNMWDFPVKKEYTAIAPYIQ